MFKFLFWRYRLDPSLSVWPISEMVPHDRLVISLCSCESSSRPYGISVETPLFIFINHKVAITLKDKRVLVTSIGPCVRGPHWSTVMAVYNQISITLHSELFRPSMIPIWRCYPKIVDESILMFLQNKISIALESQFVSATRMMETLITSIYDFLTPIIWVLLQICY